VIRLGYAGSAIRMGFRDALLVRVLQNTMGVFSTEGLVQYATLENELVIFIFFESINRQTSWVEIFQKSSCSPNGV
jgi:hypothetical protein